jgi:hypothetical protein
MISLTDVHDRASIKVHALMTGTWTNAKLSKIAKRTPLSARLLRVPMLFGKGLSLVIWRR